MNYQVLARKWRPRNFTALVGQEHVVTPIINALNSNRLHHAYLFTGTRGVGKTTIARILAKCLNCEAGVTATPCEKCNACTQINNGCFIDLIEVDAASRTKVEDTREILNNVQYLPTNARYKIYLIDEVHMLSGHSFNALLKTLEEPPAHVKFLLATTDPQKLPITVLSRCLQFNLKHLAQTVIAENLKTILHKENIQFEEEAIKKIAKAALGSMRDGLSILDQAIAFGNNSVTNISTNALLGAVDQKYIDDIILALSAQDANKIINITRDSIAEFTNDYTIILDELIDRLHQIAIAQIVPNASCNIVNYPENVIEFSKKINKQDLHYYYQTLLAGKRDLHLNISQQNGFEMLMLRMLMKKDENIVSVVSQEKTSDTKKNEISAPPKEKSTTQTKPNSTNVKEGGVVNWPEVLQKLKPTGILYAIACNCEIKNSSDSIIELLLDKNHATLLSDNLHARLIDAISKILERDIKVTIKVGITNNTFTALEQQKKTHEQSAALQSIKSDTNVQNLLASFGAEIVKSDKI